MGAGRCSHIVYASQSFRIVLDNSSRNSGVFSRWDISAISSRAAKLLLVLPFGLYGEGMLWQAATDMYFRTVGRYVGWVPPIPEEHSGWPIMSGFYRIAGVPQADDQLKAYMANHDVSAVILGRYAHYTSQPVDSQRGWLLSPTTDRERTETQALLASLRTQPLLSVASCSTGSRRRH